MILRMRAALLAAVSTLTIGALSVPAAHANVLSLLPGSCGEQAESQPFSQWDDNSSYTLVAGGDFEAGTPSWLLAGGAAAAPGNESYYVHSESDSRALNLPAGSAATSPASCTSIYHPTVRFFARNTGAPTSTLKVQALYPGLLGGVQTATIGEVAGTSQWQPSPTLKLLVSNLLATVSLDRTVIAFRFTPEGSAGDWSIDDVYLDPYCRG